MDGIPDSKDMSLSKVQEMLKDREARCAVVQGGLKESDMTELLNNINNTLLLLWRGGTAAGLRAPRSASSTHLTILLLQMSASPTVGSSSKIRTTFLYVSCVPNT